MSLIMDVLEKMDPGAAISREESKPLPKVTPPPKKHDPAAHALKSFFEAPAPGMTPKHRHPEPSSRVVPVKRLVVLSLFFLAVASVGLASWYFVASPKVSGPTANSATSRNVSRPVKPDTNFSWSTPRSAGTTSVSRSVPAGTAETTAPAGTAEAAVLQGVVLDGVEPLCLIEGKILKIGDAWEDKKITAITNQGVSLADKQGNASFIGITK